jgi:hypothetical protein
LKLKTLLVTPPFTQLNTPYPATVFLKGFLKSIDIPAMQCDLSIETILELFSAKGLEKVFNQADTIGGKLSDNVLRIINLKEEYLKTIDLVIEFLQHKKNNLANLICNGNFLPKSARFSEIDDLDWAFGTMGFQDKARHLCTLYLEDLSDLITRAIDPNFGFSRYAEHLGRYANEFDELEIELNKSESLIDSILNNLLDLKVKEFQPGLIAITVPFPGNLLCAFKCAKFVKKFYPQIKIAMGGGFASTELRSLADERVFKYFDFICLDDGELPLQCVIEYIEGIRGLEELKRTFVLDKGIVQFKNGAKEIDYSVDNIGTPDYSGLPLEKYLSVIEMANPMHSLWSNGRWNKLMLAHGCYWAKCSFCDTTLDYIKRFESFKASRLVDNMEAIIKQTGEIGFHFVDEAAPPSLLRELALEILRRKIHVVWWTNIRFEKNFTSDLCRLLSAAGCIAVSGGVEVASDRLLKLINKGIDIAQLMHAANNFTQAGIMVHTYLMYGYPTQTEQETIDSLEIVRQLFETGIVQSGFWHRFALTVHSTIAQDPDNFKIKITRDVPGKFANNDLDCIDYKEVNHDKYAEGLRVSLYNFMHGIGFDFPLQKWFDFGIPRSTIKANLIETTINALEYSEISMAKKLVWLGNLPLISYFTKTKKAVVYEMAELHFSNKTNIFNLKFDKKVAEWLITFLVKISISNYEHYTIGQMKDDYVKNIDDNFLLFLHSKNIEDLRNNGLLIL